MTDTPRKEAKMSINSGLVDAHREMELSPSVRLKRSNWFARHLWLMLLTAAVVGLFLAY